MIVKMKKMTLLCLLEYKREALDELRELGVVHINAAELKDSTDRKDLESMILDLQKASGLLSSVKLAKEPDSEFIDFTGEEVCKKTLELADEESELKKRLEKLHQAHEQLLPWGDFSHELLSDLREKGMKIYLCSENKSEFNNPDSPVAELQNSQDVTIKVVHENKLQIWFALITSNDLDVDTLPIDNIPTHISLKNVEKQITDTTAKLTEIDEQFARLAKQRKKLVAHGESLEEKLEFLHNRDGMGEADVVAYIDGYIPDPDVEKLQSAAKKHGWGLLIRDPEENENPPTYIKTPKWLDISKPIFDFIGIAPGYKEWDISAFFLIFLTIFVSIIVGDAGYGIIFLAIALFAKYKLKNNEQARLPLNLLLLMSITTIIWGFVNGTFFAIPETHLPNFMRGVKWFTVEETKNQHIQQLCFIIAAVHLSFAHFWKAILYINSRKAIGEIGWAMLVIGNYFTALNLIVYPDREWPMTLLAILYIGGFLCTVVFAINWKNVGDIFNFPFGLIGTFVDLLSYIRLFAVGLSSYYIAKSFNDMGLMILDSSQETFIVALLVIPSVLVIFAGHIGNILLAILAVLVHGIRLNTLEFSNHMALQWLGHVYKPFKKKR